MSPFTRTHRALRQTRHMTSLPGTAAAATPESTHRAEGPDAAKTATADGTRDFRNIYRHGFARIVAATAPVRIADPATNAATIAAEVARLTGRGTGAGARATSADRAAGADAGAEQPTVTTDEAEPTTQPPAPHGTTPPAEGAAVILFPELCLTGYAIDDLLLADTVLDATEAAIAQLAAATSDAGALVVVGAPLRQGSRIFNCAVALHRGRVLGVVPKSALPNYREFYERRWFAPGDDQRGGVIHLAGEPVPFGPDLLFQAADVPGLTVAIDICEDMWVPIPPSSEAALAGATVLLNLSGSPITIARAEDRHLLCRAQSARCLAAYAYAAAGTGESSNDLSWDGQTMIYETGTLLAETERFPHAAQASIADVDVARLRSERLRQGSFDDNRRTHDDRIASFRTVTFKTRPSPPRPRARPRRRPVPVRSRRRRAPRPGLLRGLQHPGLRARAAHEADRAAHPRHRCLRRPRLHPRPPRRSAGMRPARAAPDAHPRVHHARVRDLRAHQEQRPGPVRGARGHVRGASTSSPLHARCCTGSATRSPTVSRCTT